MATNADFQAMARIYASEQVDGMVGCVLGRYRAYTGLSPNKLAAWLGITLVALADLAHEPRPKIVGIDGTVRPEHGVAALARKYHANQGPLVEVFNSGVR